MVSFIKFYYNLLSILTGSLFEQIKLMEHDMNHIQVFYFCRFQFKIILKYQTQMNLTIIYFLKNSNSFFYYLQL